MQTQQQYTPMQTPPNPVRFRRSVVILGLAAILGIVAYTLMDTDDPSQHPINNVPATTVKPPVSGVITDLPQGYRDLPAEPPPPPPTPAAAPLPPDPSLPPPPPPPPDQKPLPSAQTAPTPIARQPAQAPKPEAPKRWLIANASTEKPPFARPKPAPGDQADPGLLKPAKWVTPVTPEHVLYPEQAIPALMLQAFNSDAPGTLRFLVNQDVRDLQTGNTVLIPQFSTILGKWDERPKYGDNRAQIKVQTMRLHGSGTLVDLTGGAVGGRDGASGLEANVNNHWLSVIAGAGLSALLSVGARAPFGDVEGYYPSLAQQYAQDVGSSLNRTGQRIVERELMRPPTLTQQAGYPVTIQLSEPVSFQQPPRRSAK